MLVSLSLFTKTYGVGRGRLLSLRMVVMCYETISSLSTSVTLA